MHMRIPKNALKLLFYDIQMDESEYRIVRSLAQSFRDYLFSPCDGRSLLFAIPRMSHFYHKFSARFSPTMFRSHLHYHKFSAQFSPAMFHSYLQKAFSQIETSRHIYVISANIIMENKLIYVYYDIVVPFLSSRRFTTFDCSYTTDRYRKVVKLPNGVEIYSYILAHWRRT